MAAPDATRAPLPEGGRSRARRLAGLVAGLLILGFLAWGVADGYERVSAYDWTLDPLSLAAGAIIVVGHYVAAGVGYVFILERLSARRLPRLEFLSVWGRALLGRYVPGNVLMVAGRVVLGREVGVPGRVSVAASVYEQALWLGAAAVGSLVFLAAYPGDSGQASWLWLVGVIPVGLALLHPRVFRPLSRWGLTRLRREPLSVFLSTRQVAALFAWYMLASALLALGVWLLVRSAAGAEAGGPAFVGLAFLLSFAVGMLAFVFPSGLGVREGAFALALAENLPTSVAIAVAAGVRLAVTALEVAFVGGVALLARRRRGSSP